MNGRNLSHLDVPNIVVNMVWMDFPTGLLVANESPQKCLKQNHEIGIIISQLCSLESCLLLMRDGTLHVGLLTTFLLCVIMHARKTLRYFGHGH